MLESTAIFSPCRTWRYSLTRVWAPSKRVLMFVGLNPSTADEEKNDPTVTRCVNYAHDWGYGTLLMMNIFALRSTDPRGLKIVDDPIGPENDAYLQATSRQANSIVCGWGNHGQFMQRGVRVYDLLKQRALLCLGVTKAGEPSHPLYLRRDLIPKSYRR